MQIFDDPDPVWQGPRSLLDPLRHVSWAVVAIAFVIGMATGWGIK